MGGAAYLIGIGVMSTPNFFSALFFKVLPVILGTLIGVITLADMRLV